jgi:2-polyprenyl-3-methyl-5-hydroxy-6-metoxy-1,4-benzoquinol methylase
MNVKIKSKYEQYWCERNRSSKDNSTKEKITNEIFVTASSALREGDTILDVGCGDGTLSLYFKDKFRKIYGVEIAEEAARLAQIQGVFPSVMDVNVSLSYRDNTHETIICLEVIEHLLDPCYLLSEIYRVLKPNGQLVLTTPNIRNFRNVCQLIIKGTFPHTTRDEFAWKGIHLNYFTRKDIGTLLKNAGFQRIKFSINQDQFHVSKKRKLVHFLTGEKTFGEWFCGSITVSAFKEL